MARLIIAIPSALRVSRVVNEAAPAKRGKTRGTKVEFPLDPSDLNISIPKIISTAMTKRTIPPATPNVDMSAPKDPSRGSPAKRKAIRIIPEYTPT